MLKEMGDVPEYDCGESCTAYTAAATLGLFGQAAEFSGIHQAKAASFYAGSAGLVTGAMALLSAGGSLNGALKANDPTEANRQRIG